MNLRILLAAVALLFFDPIHAQAQDDAVVLNPDGSYVDIILQNMDQNTGRSVDPADEFPSDAGYLFYESRTVPVTGGSGVLRVDTFVTPDALNLLNAFLSGGTIILNSGTYYFSSRSSLYYKDVSSNTYVWSATSMDYRMFDAGEIDFVLKGAESDKNGPKAKIVTDQFLHITADPRWNEVWDNPSSWEEIRAVNQSFENIAFDNKEYIAFRGGRSNTLIGQFGKANLAVRNCTFNGGGITFHTVGNLTFKNNIMEDTIYGVALVAVYGNSTADANLLIADNQIKSWGQGIYLSRNSTGVSDEPKRMEIIENDIEVSAGPGIDIEDNFGTPIVQRNNVYIASHHSGWGGIWLGMSDSALVKNNVISSSASTPPLAGLAVWASTNVEVKSNKVSGTFRIPLLVSPDLWNGTGLTSDFNEFIDNNLRKSTSVGIWGLPGNHILLDYGTSNNVVKGSGVAGNYVSALDLGNDNYVEGLQ